MSGAEVFLPETVMDELEREAERTYPSETGGVLLGFRDRDNEKLVQVVGQIGPGPGALHAPDRFDPDSRWQEDQIAQIYEQSGRIATYLGDWHSHPGGSPKPSKLDRSTARRIARHRQARAPNPLMVILGGCPGSWTAAGHCAGRWRLRVTPIPVSVCPGDFAGAAPA